MKRIKAASSLGLVTLLLAACAAMTPEERPARFMTVDDAFGSSAQSNEPPQGSEAIKKTVFNASYEEVFRAVSTSTAQAQFEIQTEDKRAGLILATRDVQMLWFQQGGVHGTVTPHLYFYAIRLKELGPKRTEVTIVSKVQGKCFIIHDPFPNKMDEYCPRLSAGMWSEGYHNDAQHLGQFMIFVRNNLLAAGVL
jgi:hypothetical protein